VELHRKLLDVLFGDWKRGTTSDHLADGNGDLAEKIPSQGKKHRGQEDQKGKKGLGDCLDKRRRLTPRNEKRRPGALLSLVFAGGGQGGGGAMRVKKFSPVKGSFEGIARSAGDWVMSENHSKENSVDREEGSRERGPRLGSLSPSEEGKRGIRRGQWGRSRLSIQSESHSSTGGKRIRLMLSKGEIAGHGAYDKPWEPINFLGGRRPQESYAAPGNPGEPIHLVGMSKDRPLSSEERMLRGRPTALTWGEGRRHS